MSTEASGLMTDLADMEFVTHCPPDVQPRTRIIGLCGITDFQDQASPQHDGWFISDFYLFHHLLSPARKAPQPFDKRYPNDLVKKYHEYAHGNPLQERRVVLDEDTLPQIQNSGNLRIVPRKELLDRFICTLREQARIAAKENEPLLIFIFGHGDPDTYGVQVGGDGDPANGPRLHIQHVKRVLPRHLSVTLIMTSCYSGGWIVSSGLNDEPMLNVSAITASGPQRETLSWPLSKTVGRASGSRVASAILQCLIGIEESVFIEDEIRCHPTYIQLAASIFDSLKQLDYFAYAMKCIFQPRTTIGKLNTDAALDCPFALTGSAGNLSEHYQLITKLIPRARSKVGTLDKDRLVKSLGRGYLASFPGLDELASNGVLHRRLRRMFEKNEECEADYAEKMYDQLTYRLSLMHEADAIKDRMGLEFESIFKYDVESWIGAECKKAEVGDGQNWSRCNEIDSLIGKKKIFDPPVGAAGPPYSKPYDYIAIAFVESGLEWEQIEHRITLAGADKEKRSKLIFRSFRGKKVVDDEEIISHRRALVDAMNSLPKRVRNLRSLSSGKNHEKSLVQQVDGELSRLSLREEDSTLQDN
ncbi:hypothetical protein VTN77DRAFT_7000 [Rasamsonia byssochlamydoides]|uniref:uncharacterized protein n=1 Tax=Rasamsonia byssochlamydoides TaxID=89139 RepID=UPI0037448AB8